MNKMLLDGKVAMVTAAGSGIGRASALTMAARGAQLMVTDIDLARAEAVVAEIVEAGGSAASTLCDIGDEASIRDAIAATEARFGRLDILHNNAALLSDEALASDNDVLNVPVDIWDRTMEVTVRGTMLACRYGVLAMRRAGGGSIINTGSIYGLRAANRMPAYSVSKAAVHMLTEVVATAHGREGIRCNAVAPSMMRTPTLDRLVPREIVAYNEDAALLPRMGGPQDVAEMVAFLASDAASYLTGHVFPVDGGTMAHLPTYGDERRFLESVQQA
ncbi:MAG: SDR family oxidoreductase [Rhizorhabdus sp.]|jgi:NAD(P)-dependent dehydrogenase (short-subunit alcohol dehydrogenase family)|uniref:SDR family NAD(P)-dependent oxidoreductase n=1 Tax=Rhizorhabdus sp. TaxID=1968843 RepID=UPI001B45FCA0|nr:SDR family NAD(P)-dependent oxidoreductase [Rhizorhabdus sp.]MBP8232972.1 SDR family oxidoreductase [Rhizorhabdus sp.]